MSPGILGKKIGMTQVFRPDGQVVPVTLLKAGPCVVTQRKTPTTDGYDAVQLGLVEFVKTSRISKPDDRTPQEGRRRGRQVPARVPAGTAASDLKTGDRVLVDQFKPNEKVDVIGVSKGRGFAGVVKRHHFRGGEGTTVRCSTALPVRSARRASRRRVFPGMRMRGQMGNGQVTVRNLEIIDVDTEDNVLMVKGAVPGPNGGYVMVRRAKR